MYVAREARVATVGVDLEEKANMVQSRASRPDKKTSDAKGRRHVVRKSVIIREPAVVRRRDQRNALEKVTSNGTIAAAVMVGAALLAVIVANSGAY